MNKPDKKIIINADDYETRIATLEGGQLVDLLLERSENQCLLGDIYQGKVKSIHKGMQAAFVDIGGEVNAFLYISDIDDAELESGSEINLEEKPARSRNRKGESRPAAKKKGGGGRRKKIEDMLKNGQEVLVQIVKEPIGTKGPRVTTKLSLPGRYTVLVPHEDYVGVSKRIEDRRERRRLREEVEKAGKPQGAGIIVRTEGEGRNADDFAADIKELTAVWQKTERKARGTRKPGPVYHDLGITLSFVRDTFNEEINELVVDSRAVYKSILAYLKQHGMGLSNIVSLYKEKLPIFDKYSLEEETDRMLRRKVWCRKGGYLIIDRTEAMTTIDVNSGRYSGGRNHQQSIYQTNLNAVREIARQIRLRDIGGLIVIDFVDMNNRQHRKQIYDSLCQQLKGDKAKSKILPINQLGLMTISRQRVRESVPFTISESCPKCEGLGRVVSQDTLAIKIERSIKKFRAEHRERVVELAVNRGIYPYLNEEKVQQWQRQYRLKLELKENPEFKYSQYEIKGTGKRRSLVDLLDSLFK